MGRGETRLPGLAGLSLYTTTNHIATLLPLASRPSQVALRE